MSLKDLKAEKSIADQLTAAVKSGRQVHSYLFAGGSKESRSALGTEFSKALLCSEGEGDSCGKCLSCRKFDDGNNENYYCVSKPKNRQFITADQILEVIQALNMKPFGDKTVVLIDDAQYMNSIAQNKLLKTLEEPKGNAVIILLSESEKALLDTVVSRCSTFYLTDPGSETDPELQENTDQLLRELLKGAPYYKRREHISAIIEKKTDNRDAAAEFLEAFEVSLKKLMIVLQTKEYANKDAMLKMLDSAEETAIRSEAYLRAGQSVNYTLKQFLLKL